MNADLYSTLDNEFNEAIRAESLPPIDADPLPERPAPTAEELEAAGPLPILTDEEAKAEDPDFYEEPECPACSGPGFSLGSLGRNTYYRCRNCGLDFYRS